MQTRGQKFDPLAFQVLMDPGPARRTDLTQPCFGGGVRSGERGSAPSPSLWGPDRGSLVSFQTTALVQGMAASDGQACSASGGQRHTLSMSVILERMQHLPLTRTPGEFSSLKEDLRVLCQNALAVINITHLWRNSQVQGTCETSFRSSQSLVNWALSPFYRWGLHSWGSSMMQSPS